MSGSCVNSRARARSRAAAITILTATLVSACGETEFTGQARRQADPPVTVAPPAIPAGTDLAMHHACTEPAQAMKETGLDGDRLRSLHLSGEICAGLEEIRGTVLFVVDMSGSMGPHVSQKTDANLPGSDPGDGTTCGRLQAAQRLVADLARRAGGDAGIRAGLVAFAGDELRGFRVPPQPLSQFQSSLTYASFCSYVVQDSATARERRTAGGLDASLAGVDASTNYAAAFSAAADLVVEGSEPVTVYFVSDGMPTSGGRDPEQAARDAGTRLRRQFPELTLNALLLGEDGAAARGVMEDVAGGTSRVRLVSRAEELSHEISRFPVQDLRLEDLRVWMTLDGGERRPLQLSGPQLPAEVPFRWEAALQEKLPAPARSLRVLAEAKLSRGLTVVREMTITGF